MAYVPPPDEKAQTGYIKPPDYIAPPDAAKANPGVMAHPLPGGKIALIPTRDESGRDLSDEEAQDQYWKTGNHIGIYGSPQEATIAANNWIARSRNAPMLASHAPAGGGIIEIIPGMRSAAISREQSPIKEFGQQFYAHGKRSSRELTAGLLRYGGQAFPIGEGSETGTLRGQGRNPLVGAAKEISEQVQAEPIPEPRTGLGKVGAVIGGVAPHLTPLAPLTMGSGMYEAGYQAAKERGAAEPEAQLSGMAQGGIGVAIGAAGRISKSTVNVLEPVMKDAYPALWKVLTKEVAVGGKGPVSKFLSDLFIGSAKTAVDFAAMGAANDAIAEAAAPGGGSPAEAAANLKRRLEDIKTGVAFHAVPTVIGAAGRGIRELARGKEAPPAEAPAAEAPPATLEPRTHESIVQEMKTAHEAGDMARVIELSREAKKLAPKAAEAAAEVPLEVAAPEKVVEVTKPTVEPPPAAEPPTSPEATPNIEEGGLTPQGSGTSLLSNEEIQRQQRGDAYYRVDRSGRVTDLGPQPDAPVRNGEAIIMVKGATGEPQVQNSQGLGNDIAVLGRFGNKVMQVHERGRGMIADNLGLQQMYESGMARAKEKLGLPETATDGDVVRGVLQQIGKVGSSIKETAIKIMSKMKDIGRDLAEAIANHLHEAVSGSRESQAGVIGPDIKAQHRADYGDALKMMFPGDSPEAKAARHEAWKKYRGPEEAIVPKPAGEQAPVKASLREVIDDTHLGKAFKDIKRTFGADVGEKGEATKESIRELAARAELASAQRWDVLGKLRKPFEKLPTNEQHNLIDAYEAGDKITGYGEWDSGSEWARDQYNKLWVEMNAAGIDSVGYLENYLTLMAKDKSKVGDYIGKMEKSLAGGASFLKTRELANYKTMRELGIEPEFTNMADIMTVSMANMERLIKAKRILNAEVEAGRVVGVAPDAEAPPNMVALDERMTRKIGDRVQKEGGKEGAKLKYYADPGVATVFNNHVSQGFEAVPNARNLYRWARTVSDTATSMQLAMSGFHFAFAMHDAAISTWSLGLAEAQHGNIGKGLYNIIKSAVPGWSQIDVFRDGRRLRQALLKNEIPEDLKPLAEDFLLAGGRASSSEYKINTLHTNAMQSFKQAADSFKRGDIWRAIQQGSGGALKTPIALSELINKPLMEWMIPNMKLGVFSQLAAHERAKSGTNLRPRLQKAWQVTEDRLGQMTYDNLFWNQAARQLLHVGTRSVGWNLGTINVAMGGKDAAKAVADAMRGKSPEWTHRANYITATIMFSALNGMMIQYLMGQGWPKPLAHKEDEFLPGVPGSTDMFAPRTGGTDRFGRPNRTMPAGYVKDLAEFVRIGGGRASLVDYLSSKLNPAISGAIEGLRNRDAMGNEIGTVPERIAHAIPAPISASQVMKGREQGKSWPAALAPVFGFPEAKKDLVSSHAENVMREKLNLRRAGSTTEMAEERMKLGRLAEATHAGKPESVREALSKGEISQGEFRSIQAKAREQSFLKSNAKNRNLTFEDLYDVYKAGNDDERRAIKGELIARYAREFPKASPRRQAKMKEMKANIQ